MGMCRWCGAENGWGEECPTCLGAMGEVSAREWPEYVAYMRSVNVGREKVFTEHEAPYVLTAAGKFIAVGGSEYLLERYGDLIKEEMENWPERALEAQVR